jgi:hypothetical protein
VGIVLLHSGLVHRLAELLGRRLQVEQGLECFLIGVRGLLTGHVIKQNLSSAEAFRF